jgi:hypothetical protein
MPTLSACHTIAAQPPVPAVWNHRVWLGEVAGAFGDIGTFIPLLIGVVRFAGLDAATILVFAGLTHLVTGWIFRIPMAIQPMKVIAALAIAGELTGAEVSVAGLLVAICLLILATTGWIHRLDRMIPRVLTSCIQLTVALKLVVKGFAVMGLSVQGAGLSLRGGLLVVFMVIVLMAIVCLPQYRQYFILTLVLVGFAWAATTDPTLWSNGGGLSVWRPKLIALDVAALSGIWKGGFAQLPLTLLNSVFAVTLLAGQLFPAHTARVSTTKVALSVGLMNVLTLPFGALPVCHGSGGLAAQHACGARTAWSMVVLGTIKLILGLLCGAAALKWLQAFPQSILGMFLIIAAWTLAKASRFWISRASILCAVITVATYWISGWLPLGFALGWCTHVLLSRTWLHPWSPNLTQQRECNL